MSGIFQVGLSVDETVERQDLQDLLEIFGCTQSMVIFSLKTQIFQGHVAVYLPTLMPR